MLRDKVKSQKSKLLKIMALVLWFYILVFSFCLLGYAEEQFTYDAKGKRDPFIPLVTPDGRFLKLEPAEGSSGLSLEGIIYDKHGLSYAVINGEVVSIGDKVSDYQVWKIEKDKAILLKEGSPLVLELNKEEE